MIRGLLGPLTIVGTLIGITTTIIGWGVATLAEAGLLAAALVRYGSEAVEWFRERPFWAWLATVVLLSGGLVLLLVLVGGAVLTTPWLIAAIIVIVVAFGLAIAILTATQQPVSGP